MINPHASAPDRPARPRPLSVLLAVGGPGEAEPLADLVRSAGHVPYVAIGAGEAQWAASELVFDAALMSAALGAAPLQALARGLRNRANKALRLVALAGGGEDPGAAALLAGGFDACIPWPADGKALADALRGPPAARAAEPLPA